MQGQKTEEKIAELTSHIDSLQISLEDKTKECELLSQQKTQVETSFHSERQVLNEEIQSLQEQVALIKKEVTILQDAARQATAARVSSSYPDSLLPRESDAAFSSVNHEEALLIKERLEKAESDVEKLRLSLHTKIEELNKSQQALNTMRFEKIKINE